ncbi:MAG: hypothetical protein JWO78_2213 [Micavibrio sp.]|nr:hypothetical protein [Micavibrio sp.]
MLHMHIDINVYFVLLLPKSAKMGVKMSVNTTKEEFSNAADQNTVYVYDCEINNYVEKPAPTAQTESLPRPDAIYVPEKNAYDTPSAP